jgi:hypothetical protein
MEPKILFDAFDFRKNANGIEDGPFGGTNGFTPTIR